MPILWGRWYTEEETKAMARELDQIGRNIEKQTRGLVMWINDVKERQKQNPQGKVF